MNNTLTIAVIIGTTRPGRKSIRVAKYIADYGAKIPDIDIIFVDPIDYIFPGDGNSLEGKDPKYSDITAKADGFFIITPEYNHSYSSSLKRMLDSEYGNYLHKAVAIAGVSKGNWGGARATEALTLVARELGLVVTHKSPLFPQIQDTFDESNQPNIESKDMIDSTIKLAYDELIWMATALKVARES